MESIPCDLCPNKATVYFTQIIDGKMQKVNLCEKCAREKGVTDPTGFALADLLFGIGQQQNLGHPPGRQPQSCPQCGLTAEQLKKTGRVGCPQCYEVFSESMSSILKAMHKGITHHGKVPIRLFESRARSMRLRDLKAALDQAVADERFEDAAAYRDDIQTMEQSAGGKKI